jgi:hypothetical protein
MESKRVTVRIEKISPELADKWLSSQERNRAPREDRVAFWLDIIQRGEWRITNDCITFDPEGRLTNGQHRLAAIHLSGVTCEAGVMRNLPAEAQDIMDSGLVRRTNDALEMRGEKNAFVLAGGLRWEHRLRYIAANPESDAVHYSQGQRPSTPQLLEVFDEDPEMWREMASIGQGLNRIVGMRSSLGACAMHRFWRLSADDAAGFHEGLTTGVNLQEGDPILQLRSALTQSKRRRGERMPDYREMALVCKAWNLWRVGDRRGVLTWHFGGVNREPFPIPR